MRVLSLRVRATAATEVGSLHSASKHSTRRYTRCSSPALPLLTSCFLVAPRAPSTIKRARVSTQDNDDVNGCARETTGFHTLLESEYHMAIIAACQSMPDVIVPSYEWEGAKT